MDTDERLQAPSSKLQGNSKQQIPKLEQKGTMAKRWGAKK
jgi:hypothetical protein